ncbi:AzlC family ABC transporter permease [Streptomyces sp. AJS327]|uniref:AzlC family ABC transporter permease n=1 Tax=Streptomyces sp. AJS327 TaxID=2545265 RepID=UPI0035B5056D
MSGARRTSGATGAPGTPRAAVPPEPPRGDGTRPGSGSGADPDRGDRAVVRDALGVGVAVGLSGFAFGVTAADAGITPLQACVLSLFVFTGASQFALVSAVATGVNPVTAAAGAFFLGLRNAFYGLRLATLLRLPGWLRPLAAHWVIDETSVVALAQRDRRTARLGFVVTGCAVFVLWNATTLLGVVGAGALGDTSAWGLDAAGPAVFLALLAPMLRTPTERATAALAVLLGLGLLPLLPSGVPVLAAALAAPAVLLVRTACGRGRRGDGSDGETAGPTSPKGHLERARVERDERGESTR